MAPADLPPSPVLGADGDPCPSCAAPLAADQRYCLECGARRGPARLDVLAAARARARSPRTVLHATPPAAAPVVVDGTGAPRGIAGGFAAVGPRVAATLCLAMLTGGIALGAAAGPGADSSVAAGGPRRIIVVQAPAAAPPPAAPVAAAPVAAAPAAEEPAPAEEEAVVEEEPAPEAAPVVEEPAPVEELPAEEPPPADETPVDEGEEDTPDIAPPSPLPPVKHVWVVMLTGQRYAETWGPKAADPAFRALATRGTVLSRVFGVAHGTLPSAIALLSGQGPNPDTQAGCAAPGPLTPGTIAEDDPRGQAAGRGCVLPAAVPTLLDQLTGAGLTWKGYVESLGEGCTGTGAGPAYVAARNPFALFAGVVGDPVCGSNVAGIDRLDADLVAADQTPSLSYIVPDACHDGRPEPCAPGAPSGLTAAGPWLTGVVDRITATDAYKDGGLIIVTGDQAPVDGPLADARGCRCTLNSGGVGPFWPNTPDPGLPAAAPDPAAPATRVTRPPRGGGRVGALLLSPYVTPGRVIGQSYDHVSLLASIEDLFGLQRLGAATDPAHRPLGRGVYAQYTPPADR